MEQTLEFVLEQSCHGNHLWFDETQLTRVLPTAAKFEVDPKTAAQTESLVESLREIPQIGDQRALIQSAPAPVQDVFVRLYFRYLDGFMARRGAALH
ncbi:MAG: hypothetical protein ACI9MR_001470 [Myxococcota bacterium]|jgi:hypothetical protein